MVAKLERVALREALPQRVVECAALEMRLHPFQPVAASCATSCFIWGFLRRRSILYRLVSYAATGLGSKMVARCSVFVR
jgi:hypothetical protein